jgi:CRP/FNR family transcriptional regulator
MLLKSFLSSLKNRPTVNILTTETLISLFSFLKGNHQLAEKLMTHGIRQSIKEHAMIYWEGDSCSHIALILEGHIRVYKKSSGSREITLYEIGPGETCILNASCILSNSGYPANATAMTDLEVLLLPAHLFMQMMELSNEIRHFVFSMLSQRLASVMTLLEEVVFNRMDERLDDYLIEKSENDKLIATHQSIANDLGTSREVVSRLLKDMERKGKISLSRNVVTLLKY